MERGERPTVRQPVGIDTIWRDRAGACGRRCRQCRDRTLLELLDAVRTSPPADRAAARWSRRYLLLELPRGQSPGQQGRSPVAVSEPRLLREAAGRSCGRRPQVVRLTSPCCGQPGGRASSRISRARPVLFCGLSRYNMRVSTYPRLAYPAKALDAISRRLSRNGERAPSLPLGLAGLDGSRSTYGVGRAARLCSRGNHALRRDPWLAVGRRKDPRLHGNRRG
jgi:hypothetical protein